MRALSVRRLTFLALTLFFASHDAAWAQTAGSRTVTVPIEPLTPTRLEFLLATPNTVLITDYYRIDMRFGPSIRIDAVIVHGLDPRVRMKGLRVQVRDPESRGRQDGTSFIDLDELIRLTTGLTAMAELAEKWTHDDRQATELSFTTTGGFRLAIRQSARVPRAYLSTGLLDPVVTSMDLHDLPTLKHAFEQALAILNSK